MEASTIGRRVLRYAPLLEKAIRKVAKRFLVKAIRARRDRPSHAVNADKNPASGEAIRRPSG